MKAGTLATDVTAVQGVAQTILATIEAVDPAAEVPAEAAAQAIALVGDLVTAALSAYSNANGIAITAESVAALLPNAAPLTPPPAGS